MTRGNQRSKLSMLVVGAALLCSRPLQGAARGTHRHPARRTHTWRAGTPLRCRRSPRRRRARPRVRHLRQRQYRRLRLGGGDRGRLRAVRGRRRRARRLAPGRSRGGGASRPRSLPAVTGGDDPRSGLRSVARHDPRRGAEDERHHRRRERRAATDREAVRPTASGRRCLTRRPTRRSRGSGSRRPRHRRSAPTSRA